MALVICQCPIAFAQDGGYIEDDGAALWEEEQFLDTTGREFESLRRLRFWRRDAELLGVGCLFVEGTALGRHGIEERPGVLEGKGLDRAVLVALEVAGELAIGIAGAG